MKKTYSLLALIGGVMILIPYIFLGKQWNLLATFICIVSAIIILVNIIYTVMNIKKKDRGR
jgi:VIT1/CCC1 family predicted Fe2+/Mn2+ transporter